MTIGKHVRGVRAQGCLGSGAVPAPWGFAEGWTHLLCWSREGANGREGGSGPEKNFMDGRQAPLQQKPPSWQRRPCVPQ